MVPPRLWKITAGPPFCNGFAKVPGGPSLQIYPSTGGRRVERVSKTFTEAEACVSAEGEHGVRDPRFDNPLHATDAERVLSARSP